MGDDESSRRIVLTNTAKSKAYRYLNQRQVEAALKEHSGAVYYNDQRDQWLVRTTHAQTSAQWNHEREETIVLVVDVDGDTLVVVTQTSDHYDWSDFEEVPRVGAKAREIQENPEDD